ncbi:hypothetical protein TCON_1646 [Astathelohania contejeani]|uniref:Uncharacterized protein n=1 Tax=Astathelohania contejeani TaxID=164912 RepID=A0ABQ7HY82_9MICR|nr:hypothetical protein TCON_1646 [Thelohania contejeani]
MDKNDSIIHIETPNKKKNIRSEIIKSCEYLLYQLDRMREGVSSEDKLIELLLDIHQAYLALVNKIEIFNKKGMIGKINLVDKGNGLFIYKDKYTVVFDNGVLSVDTGHKELNHMAMEYISGYKPKDQIERLEIFLALYLDYEWRICDRCLEYGIGPYFRRPIVRRLEEDYISAYHEECKN